MVPIEREGLIGWPRDLPTDRPCATELLLGQILLRLVCRISSEECGPSRPSVRRLTHATEQLTNLRLAANEAEAGKWSESDASRKLWWSTLMVIVTTLVFDVFG